MMSEFANAYLMHGICYWLADTGTNRTPRTRIKSLIALDDQFYDVFGKRIRLTKYMFGEMGVSVHMTDNGAGILIGAPGIWEWSGSVVRLRRQRSGGQWTTIVANPTLWQQPKFSYFGYAVTSGRFFGAQLEDVLVASAPRAGNSFGEVYLFGINGIGLQPNISIYQTLRGLQMGEYFGYALLADDFDGDKRPELVVAAPLNAVADSYENGAVYVFGSRGGGWLQQQMVLRSPEREAGGGRFGTSVASIGDVNGDGYNGKEWCLTLVLTI